MKNMFFSFFIFAAAVTVGINCGVSSAAEVKKEKAIDVGIDVDVISCASFRNSSEISKIFSGNMSNASQLLCYRCKDPETEEWDFEGEYVYFHIAGDGCPAASEKNGEPDAGSSTGSESDLKSISLLDWRKPSENEINIYFPADCRQPTSEEAGILSGARVTDEEISQKITDLYMFIFGGKAAVKHMYNPNSMRAYKECGDKFPQFGITSKKRGKEEEEKKNIITVEVSNINKWTSQQRIKKRLEKAEEDFWDQFRTIASDPVGRVLLYRILIEIMRVYKSDYNLKKEKLTAKLGTEKANIEANTGAYEYWNDETHSQLKNRNSSRSIIINRDENAHFFHEDNQKAIRIVRKDALQVLKADKTGRFLSIKKVKPPLDVVLFHEMLHWFHYLRDSRRFKNERVLDYQEHEYYLFDYYYGDQADIANFACDAWNYRGLRGGELRNILGTPSDKVLEMFEKEIKQSVKFLNGDDLSENAYRCSRHTAEKPIYMRFGWSDLGWNLKAYITDPDPYFLEVSENGGFDRHTFALANFAANQCYKDITGTYKQGWRLKPGEAVKPYEENDDEEEEYE